MSRFGRLMSREELNPGSEVDPSEVDAAVVGADTAETELLEVNDMAVGAEADGAAIEQAADVAEGMEETAAAMESILAAGGMSREVAATMHKAFETMCIAIGTEPAKPLPSMESFGGASRRAEGTRLTIQGIKETAKEIWQTIIKNLKKIKDWVMGYVNKVIGTGERLKKRAAAVKAKANDMTGHKLKADGKNFENDSIAAALHVSGVITPSNVIAGLENTAKLCNDIEIFYGAPVKSMATNLAAVADAIDAKDAAKAQTKQAAFTASMKEAFKAFEGAIVHMGGVDNATSDEHKTSSTKKEVVASKEMPGGKCVVVTAPLTGGTLRDLSLSIAIAKRKGKNVEGKKLTTLDMGQINDIASEAEKVADSLIVFRDVAKKVEKSMADFEKSAQEMIKTISDYAQDASDDGNTQASQELSQEVKDMKSNLAGLGGVFQAPISTIGQYSVTLCKAALDYCEKSFGMYEKA